MPILDWGSQELVNTTTAGDQSAPQAAGLSNGGYVVVWENGSGGSQTTSIRLFDASGNPIGAQFAGPSVSGGASQDVDVVATRDGGFVVSWITNPPIAGGSGQNDQTAFYQRYDSQGNLIGSATNIETLFAPPPSDDITQLTSTIQNGQVTFNFATTASNRWGFNQLLTGLAGETSFAIGTSPIEIDSIEGALGGTSNNGIVASVTLSGGGTGIVYAPNLFAAQAEIDIGNAGTHTAVHPRADTLVNGDVVAVWQEQSPVSSGDTTQNIFLDVFDATGASAGPLAGLDPATNVAGDQLDPDVLALPDGGFLVVWSNGGNTIEGQVFRQQENPFNHGIDVERLGSEFTIAPSTSGTQRNPTASLLNDGRVLVTWEGSDGSGTGIQSQIINPTSLTAPGDFNRDNFSDILFSGAGNDLGYYQVNTGQAQWQHVGTTSAGQQLLGTGDFDSDNAPEALWRNNSTGAFGYYDVGPGPLVSHDLGPSSTAYSVVGIGDFNGDGNSDVLMRDSATNDVGYYAISNGAVTAWHHLDYPSSAYVVAGIGDFDGDGTSDVLYRNNTTGDFGYDRVSNDVTTWQDLGASSPSYSIVGVADLDSARPISGGTPGGATSDILFQNSTTGDFGYYAVANGAATWHDLGVAAPGYNVVGTGDYNGDHAADVLFRNDATGDFGYFGLNDHGNPFIGSTLSSWVDLGSSSTAYQVVQPAPFTLG